MKTDENVITSARRELWWAAMELQEARDSKLSCTRSACALNAAYRSGRAEALSPELRPEAHKIRLAALDLIAPGLFVD